MLEVLRSGRLSLGPLGERFERAFADWLGVGGRGCGLQRHHRPAPRRAGARLGRRRRGPDQPLQLRRLGQLPSLRGRPAGLLRRRSADPEPRSRGGRGSGRRAHRWHPAGPHLRLPGGAAGAGDGSPSPHGLGILEDACEALGASTPRGAGSAPRGNLATFAFYANKQMTTGEGGMIVPRDAEEAARLRSERNQGRAVDMGWLDHDRLGFNYRLSDLAAAIGRRPGREARLAVGGRDRRRGAVRAAAGGDRGRARHRCRRAARSGAAGSSTSCCRRGSIATRRSSAWPSAGIASKAYLPCIHLFPHLRELGYREGQFPVAEAASAHSLALPFFPAMGEGAGGPRL